MMPLMPTTAKGHNVFHPGQVEPNSQPDDDGKNNDDENGKNGDGANRNDESGALAAGADVDANTDADENEAQRLPENEGTGDNIPWSPSPPPRIRSPRPSAIQKCRHSAISSGTTSTTSTVSKNA
jgi:hypothetical protein